MSELHAISEALRAPSSRRGQNLWQWLALAVAILLSGVAATAAFSRAGQPDWAMLMLVLFAATGIGALYALGFGLLRLGREDQRGDLCAALCASGNAAAVTSARGEVLFSNPAFAALGGAEAGQARPHDILSAADDEGATVFRFASAAARGESHHETVRLRRGLTGGDARWLRVGMVPLSIRRNGRNALAWHFFDVSEEMSALLKATTQETRYRNRFDAVPAGVILADAAGRVTAINPAMQQLLTRSARAAGHELGLDDIFTNASLHLLKALPVSPPGSRKTRTARLELLQDRGAPVLMWAAFCPVETEGNDGADICISLMRDSDADSLPLVGTPDPSVMSQYVHSAPVAIASVNQSGRVSNANAAFHQTFGVDASRRDGKPASIIDLVDPQSREAVVQALKDAAQRRAPKAPVDISFKGEPRRSGQLYVVPLQKTGARRGRDVAVIYAIDTSEQRRLEEQIAQNQKMQEVGQLAGGIAHDFNNLLQVIIGYSDLLLTSHRPSDPAFSDIMHIRNNANRAAALIGHLLAYSRCQTLLPKVWSLTDIIEEFSHLLGRLLGEKVTANVVHGRDLWLVKADSNQLEQVIMNLAVNARDAMLPGGGELTIRTANVTERESLELGASGVEPGEYVLLEVSDTGCGMPPEIMNRIFEPFFSTKEIGEGTGFGLSVVHGIVKQTGGYILVDSRVGEGTSFRIYLPRHVEEEDIAAGTGDTPVKMDVQRDLTGSGTILLVEDEEEVRGFATRALANRGYRVLQAASGVDALEIIAAHDGKIDLMITDVMMPQMDGPSLFRQVRKSAPHIKVIFMSGYAEQTLREDLSEGENFHFLPKPFPLKGLAELVKQVLS
jgi:two-component system cell cycle sensor histidine kinase/response regulator CckA